MTVPNLEPPDSRRIAVHLPRLLWIGLATAVLVVVAAVLRFGTPAYRQHTTIRELEQANAYVKTELRGRKWLPEHLGSEWSRVFGNVVSVEFRAAPATDAILSRVGTLTELERLDLAMKGLTSVQTTHLAGLTKLQFLRLDSNPVENSSLVHLQGCTNLRELNLGGTRVTDAGMVHLKGLPRLERLWLFRTAVTDAGLVDLASLRDLKELGLNNTQVTDEGLLHLTGLTNLKFLDLYDTKVTDAGIATLRRSLPGLTIER